jgi:TRAP-type C4-dicarboxylate transport system permease small subunit
MNRSLLNLTIDLLAAACLLAMVATGYKTWIHAGADWPAEPSTLQTRENP